MKCCSNSSSGSNASSNARAACSISNPSPFTATSAADTGDVVANDEVTRLIATFFDTDTAVLDVVPGAAAALAALGDRAQILILSNLPESAREARQANLAGHGMPYPVVAGSGPKGIVVKRLIEDTRQPVVFIDDLPPHHTSVAAETPTVHRLHFVADPRLAALLPPARDAHKRIDEWPAATNWIASVIGEA